jgi:hypothetical protein
MTYLPSEWGYMGDYPLPPPYPPTYVILTGEKRGDKGIYKVYVKKIWKKFLEKIPHILKRP